MFLFLVFHFLIVPFSDGRTRYNYGTTIGTEIRNDLLNGLKLALKHAKPPPTKEEHKAALDLVKFINSSDSNDYVQAFYYNDIGVTTLTQCKVFINGIVFNGDPNLPVWEAAKILAETYIA
ncbi:hypothetical protein ILUMI_17264 [Ignelater luminosus]|uniref:Uncharacterized protein n=1 Tax=Ignelater luminosus TaxID=2038154 RepID=A0A8K0CK71_IGNLU|nr:hypothetical protein ILUMI_17264 [Ignelater luminosus]